MKLYTFYIALFLTILIGFFLLVPKVAPRVFPFIRHDMLSKFLVSSQKSQSINGKEFWMLREYYSPGSFIFKEKGLTPNETNQTMKQFSLKFNEKAYLYPYMIFNAEKFHSIEALTEDTNLNRVIQNFDSSRGKNCIIDQISTYICKKTNGDIEIAFIKSLDEMKNTNGFFDYKRNDLANLTKGKSWLVITTIHL